MISAAKLATAFLTALLFSASAIAASSQELLSASKWTRNPKPYASADTLDISTYDLAWSDDFNTLAVTKASGAGPWYTNVMPFQGGLAQTVGIGDPRYPVYFQSNGILTLRAAKLYLPANGEATTTVTTKPALDGKGVQRWVGGHMQTVNAKGQGFALQDGYFEARMKVPNVRGAWPAFWIKSINKWTDYPPNGGAGTQTTTEIDVIEHYGPDDQGGSGHHHTVHLWPAPKPPAGTTPISLHRGDYYGIKDAAGKQINLGLDWHAYGVQLTPDWIIICLDRKELARFPRLEEFKGPHYLLLTEAVCVKEAPFGTSPIDLQVDYVKVWKPKPVVVESPAPPPVPTVSLSTDKPANTIQAGDSITLTWASTDATACTASGAWNGTEPVSGSLVLHPASSGTYTLACTGAGGSAAQSLRITVIQPSPPPPPPPAQTDLTETVTTGAGNGAKATPWATAGVAAGVAAVVIMFMFRIILFRRRKGQPDTNRRMNR